MSKPTPFTDRLQKLFELSDKSNLEIAAELDYSKPNIISMFKQGTVKVPLTKVPAMAKALHADPEHMMLLALEEYMPETLEVMRQVLGVQTRNERRLLEAHRRATHRQDPHLSGAVLEGYVAVLNKHGLTGRDQG